MHNLPLPGIHTITLHSEGTYVGKDVNLDNTTTIIVKHGHWIGPLLANG